MAIALDPVGPVAMLFAIARIAGTQARARAGSKFRLGEFAFDRYKALRSPNHHVYTGRSRLSQPIHLVFELKRDIAMFVEECRPSAFGGEVLQKIEPIESPDSPEHALS